MILAFPLAPVVGNVLVTCRVGNEHDKGEKKSRSPQARPLSRWLAKGGAARR